jgi:putative sterol carrier protein
MERIMTDLSNLTVTELVLGHEQAFVPEKAIGVDAVIQYRLLGDEGGDWNITIKDGKCEVAQGVAQSPKMTLTASGRDFRDIMLGKMDGMLAFMQGKLKITGDMNLAMRWTSFFKVK